jgi:DNA-directed RNA polymerase specialized sigma24 family protein
VTEPDPARDLAADEDPTPVDSDHAQDLRVTLDQLVAEHRAERLGQLWLTEIRAACSSRARRYSPQVYARAANWDEPTLQDLVMDTTERLLAKAQIEYICDHAADLAHARALLHRQVRHTLLDRRTRSVVDNLVDRAVEQLRQGPYVEDPTPPPGWRRLGPHAGGPSGEVAVRLLGLRLRRLPRLAAEGTERASPVWSSTTLTTAIDDVLDTLGRATRQDLSSIFGDALTSLTASELASDEAGFGHAASDLGPEGQAIASEVVVELMQQLDPLETTVLSYKFQGRSDADAAAELGLSRPTIDARKKAAAAKVRHALRGLDGGPQDVALQLLQQRIISFTEGQSP